MPPPRNESDRADYWLGRRFPGLSRSQVLEALELGLVRAAGGRRLRKGDRVAPGAEPDCTPLAAQLERVAAGNPALDVPVLLETEELVVVDKPAGMPGHPLHLQDFETVTHWALARYPELRDWCTQAQPTVTPHRLDTDTSGVLLVARTAAEFARWRRRFSRGEVRKQYLAWCWGNPAWDACTLDQPIGHAPGERGRMAVTTGDGGRRAVSEVSVLQRLPDRCLCELRLCTGVTHQVRVHMAASGHPLLGDRRYDPQFEQRADHPPYALLRAVDLGCGAFAVAAPREKFAALYGC